MTYFFNQKEKNHKKNSVSLIERKGKMNLETTTAFVAGALVPTLTFVYCTRLYNNNPSQQQEQIKNVVEEQKKGKEQKENENDQRNEKNDSDQVEVENDDNYDDDESSGQLSTDDDPDGNINNSITDCSSWGMTNVPYKMVLVVNMDLTMGKGKIAAQCGHAAVGCYKRCIQRCPSAIRAWEYTGCAKIAVKCPNVNEMQHIAQVAKEHGVPYYLVEDAGRTQIAAGSKTVLGLFGPVSVFEGITDHLKLM